MNYNNIILALLGFFCSSFFLGAQELTGSKDTEFGRFNEKTVILSNFSPSFGAVELNSSSPSMSISGGNNIFISQAGKNNNIRAEISSHDAIVEIDQSGDENGVQMKIEADIIRGVVTQTGYDNQVFDYVPQSDEPVVFHYKQRGNFQHIESYGSNSISNRIKVELVGDSKAIIIRNFN